ncbi:MAG: hypothetical protein U0235_08375 [Polyangiaceae bacterium]
MPRDVEHTTTFLTDVTLSATWLARDFVDQVLDAWCARYVGQAHDGDGAARIALGQGTRGG